MPTVGWFFDVHAARPVSRTSSDGSFGVPLLSISWYGVVAPSVGAVPLQTSRAVVPLVGSSGLRKNWPVARP